jgi:hypothetical protein
MADRIDIAVKEDGARKRGRFSLKKIPLLGSQEGKIHVMQILDETGGDQYKPRIRKYPGFSVLESFLKTDRQKDGRKVEYSAFQMLQRAATSGAYNAQMFLYWLGKKTKDDDLIADRQGEVELPAVLQEALEPKDHDAQVMKPTGTDVGMPGGNHGIRFGIPPYENVLNFEGRKRLMGSDAVVVAPRLIANRSGEFMVENGAAKIPVVPAPRLLTNQKKDVITKDDSDVKQVTGPSVAGILPPPKPAQRRGVPVVDSDRGFELVRKGRTAARKAALEKGREKAEKIMKKADKER